MYIMSELEVRKSIRQRCLQVWKEDRKTYFAMMDALCDKSSSFQPMSEDTEDVPKYSSIGSPLAEMEQNVNWAE